MTIQRKADVTCPSCGVTSTVAFFNTVNVTHDPELEQAVLHQRLNRFVCSCGAGARLREDLLYDDMDRKFMIQLAATRSVDEARRGLLDSWAQQSRLSPAIAKVLGSLTTRVVSSYDELVEKVLVFRCGLDDRALEVTKLAFRLKQGEAWLQDAPVFFDSLSDEGLNFVTFRDGEELSFVLPRYFYEHYREALRVTDMLEASEPWSLVDATAANALLLELARRSEAMPR